MSRPLTPDELLAALKRWGITVNEQPGWRTRTNGSGWGDVVGFMWHHTGDDAPDSVDLRIVRDGRAGLPGPLSQFGLRDDGSVDLIAAGAANHAGGGDPLVLAAVSGETYTTRPPASRFAHGQAGSISGNGRFYGVETFYSGTHAPTSPVKVTMPLLAAAIIDGLDRIDTANKWTSKSGIGHKEWQRGKVDPGNVDCADLRAQTQALLNAGPRGTTTLPSRTQTRTPLPPEVTVKTIDLRGAGVPARAVTGPGVKPMQRLLGVPPDGFAGPGTRAALIAARIRAGLRGDAIFDAATATALLAGK